MKVYIITEIVRHEGETIQAVFLDEEKAKERLAQWEKHLPVAVEAHRKPVWYDMSEHDVEE